MFNNLFYHRLYGPGVWSVCGQAGCGVSWRGDWTGWVGGVSGWGRTKPPRYLHAKSCSRNVTEADD